MEEVIGRAFTTKIQQVGSLSCVCGDIGTRNVNRSLVSLRNIDGLVSQSKSNMKRTLLIMEGKVE